MIESVIIGAKRSPIGINNGKMVGIRPDDLASQVVRGLLEKINVEQSHVNDLVLGCAFPEGPQGMLMAKGVAILAGLPETVGGSVVNRFCGSSMDAVHQISSRIETGDIEMGIAVGMGETAEILAREGSISRDEQEEFAIKSHEKALDAWENGRFDDEVIPTDMYGEYIIDKDEGPRVPDIEKIKSLSPAFMENGTITAVTASITSGDFDITQRVIRGAQTNIADLRGDGEFMMKIRRFIPDFISQTGNTRITFNLLTNLSLKLLDVSFVYPTTVPVELIPSYLLLPSIFISNDLDPVGFLSSLMKISTSARS